jgi:isopenicillin-N N-acyltransferase-like protein
MSRPTRYREIEVSGPPRELGRQIGEAARDEIRGFAAVALERVNKTMRVSRDKALAVAQQSIPYAADYSLDMMDELAGMSEASGVPLVELMLLQVRNQLRGEDAGCTSFALAAGAYLGDDGQPLGGIVAQNWDNDPALDDFTIVLTRRPVRKPATMNVTQAGLIAYIGFSEAGIGACLNTLPAPSRAIGVPHYFTLRGIYEARSRDEAAATVRRAHRAIPANIMLITPQGPADFEITPDEVHVLHVDESLRDSHSRLGETRPREETRPRGRLTHTNHCLHACLAEHNQQFPELIQSHPRKRRIDELLSIPGPLRLQQIQDALRDHENHPRSICRHANEDAGTGFWETVFSVVIEPSARRMHVTRGTPCERPYETYVLSPK